MCLNTIAIGLAAIPADFGLLVALDISAIAHWTGIILKAAFALGFVIFVHELGHFLVARACGVKCEKFMVGFDIGGYKLSRKWGDTVYGIGIVPLGGYVKMLGQDDDPAQVAEQMKKSQVDAQSGQGVEVTGPNGETYVVDRRSYLAKSVPQRMAIISAGVIMNVIFAFIFAVIAYGLGVPYMPSIVSESMPGSPAWTAGIEPGDEIVQLGDRVTPTFNQLRGGVMLGDHENGIPTVVRRAETGEDEALVLKPERSAGKLAKIGIAPPYSLTLYDKQPTARFSAAARAVAAARDDATAGAASASKEGAFQGGDRIIRINGVDVKDYRDYAEQIAQHPDEMLEVTVARNARTSNEQEISSDISAANTTQELTFQVPTHPLRSFGLIMQMGPITGIQENSPAAKAGLRIGDVIEAINGEKLDGTGRWEPLTIPQRMSQAAQAGEQVTLTVKRATGATADSAQTFDTEASNNTEQVDIVVAPVPPNTFHALLPPGAPMGVPSLGLAYQIENRVAAVVPDGPAASADISAGDRLVSANIILPKDAAEELSEMPTAVDLSDEKSNLPSFFLTLQHTPPGTEIEFTVARGDQTDPIDITVTPMAADDLFVAERGFTLMPIERIRKATSFAQQLEYGWDETVDSLMMVYRFMQKLGTQVPLTALGGPVTIAKAAGYSAAEGLSSLLIFLTMLSANLAVINFLPIPVLDGGHMVFLAYEGLRGRPANEKVVGYMHLVGFALIVSLMLFVLALDLEFIPRNL